MIDDDLLQIQEAYLRIREDRATADDVNLINTIVAVGLIERDRAAGLKAGLELQAEMRERPKPKVD